MKSLYAHLAADNIRKNRRLYVPYLLSGIVMAAILYILGALSADPAVLAIPGGEFLAMLLLMGVFILMLFSAIFLFYTSSFLMKQRNRELGLYNVLGMSKRHLVRVVVYETLFCALICIGGGLVLGILLSKLFQLALLRLTASPVDAAFAVSAEHVGWVCLAFGVIYAALALVSSLRILLSKPLDLMVSSRAGERPPRANLLSALAGIVCLAAGYALALRVRSALEALNFFFPAVGLVILGTELCFRSGSMTLLRLLRLNKAYYYKPNHFISVSGMSYRMKRSGSSLSVICILSTMVLVTLSCVTCLYAGTEDAVRNTYPRELDFYAPGDRDGDMLAPDALSAPIEAVLAETGAVAENTVNYRAAALTGTLEDGTFTIVRTSGTPVASLAFLTIMPLEDYNALCGTDYTLEPGQALAGRSLAASLPGSVTIEGVASYSVAATDIPVSSEEASDGEYLASLLLVVPSAADLFVPGQMAPSLTYAFDIASCPIDKGDLVARLCGRLRSEGVDYTLSNGTGAFDQMLSEYAGLFFLGIMLSLAFTCAAVLSMYYKQVTEGYEDQANFAIMRKVGLSRKMIRRSVNSQILTVFFLPLIVSGVHIAFAFPMLSKLLFVLGISNVRLLAQITLASFALFAVFYVAVYLVTSRTYYKIVSSES